MQKLINEFQIQRKGREDIVVLEGFHALKHALRFGAEIVDVYSSEDDIITEMSETVRDEDLITYIKEHAQQLSPDDFSALAPRAARTGIVARARKDTHLLDDINKREGYIVILENPRDLDNIGAVIRVCAARGIAGLIVTGDSNPWHATTIRAAAGLHWAVPIVSCDLAEALTTLQSREIYACTDEGRSIYTQNISSNGVLVFGTEREGLQQTTRERLQKKVAIPMQGGVSSLNLATSVTAILYTKV